MEESGENRVQSRVAGNKPRSKGEDFVRLPRRRTSREGLFPLLCSQRGRKVSSFPCCRRRSKHLDQTDLEQRRISEELPCKETKQVNTHNDSGKVAEQAMRVKGG